MRSIELYVPFQASVFGVRNWYYRYSPGTGRGTTAGMVGPFATEAEALADAAEQYPPDVRAAKLAELAQDAKRAARNRRARVARRARASAMESLGMVRGKDSRGRTIWE